MGSRPPRDARSVYLTIEAVSGFAFYTMATMASVYRIVSADLDPLQLVLVGTALEASAFIFELPTGIMADAISRRRSVIVGTFLIGAGFVLEASFPSFLPILAGQVVWGLGFAFVSGADVAWVTDEVGEAPAASLYLRGAQLGNLTALAGIAASVGLAIVDLWIPVFVGGAVYIALAIYLLFVMPETGFVRPAERTKIGSTVRTGLGSVRSMLRVRPVLIAVLVISALHGASTETFDRLWEFHLLRDVGLPSLGPVDPFAWFGILNAGGLLLGIGAIEVVKRRVDVTAGPGVVRAIAVLNVLLIAATLVFAFAGQLLLAVAAFWSVALLRHTHEPVFQAWVNRGLDPTSRATMNSAVSQADAVGQIAGGPLLGLLAALRSAATAIGAAALLRVPVLGLLRGAASKEEPPHATVNS